jgi:hypothetical protein
MLIIFIIFTYINSNSIDAQDSTVELNMGFSMWQLITDDSKYSIQDYGTRPPPRNVIVRNLEDGEIIFSGEYYQNINLQGHTIEIVKFYGEYYGGEWSINPNLNEAEIIFAKTFLEINTPPEELVQIADLAKGNGLGLLIILEYNFETKESKMIGGKYIGTM